MTPNDATIRSEFIEGLGIVAQDEGMSRIAGRIMGLLLYDGRAVSFSDLATELAVSRGSISANVRLLLDRGVIRKTAKPGDRQDYFEFSDRPYEALMAGVSLRAQKTAHWITSIRERDGGGDAARLQRLANHADFYRSLSSRFRQP